MTVEEKLTPLLQALLAGAQEVLGEELVGLYLLGSLAIGGFKEGRSDVDFAAACERPLTEETIARLAAMHARITAGGLPFAEHMEGSYPPERAAPLRPRRHPLPRAALRRLLCRRPPRPGMDHSTPRSARTRAGTVRPRPPYTDRPHPAGGAARRGRRHAP